jgi:sulfate permease, SulP family
MLPRKLLPLLEWLPDYKRAYLSQDFGAGLTVAVILIPQAMAYALLAGLPPIHGLYAAILPLILYSILGTSRKLAVGPVALDAIIIAGIVGGIVSSKGGNYLQICTHLAVTVGLVQVAWGIFRLGFLVNLLSFPIISGFTTAAALLICTSQLKHLLGLEIANSQYLHEVIYALLGALKDINLTSLLIGSIGMGILLGLKKIKSKLPAALLIVFASTLVVWIGGLQNEVSIIGEIPQGLPTIGLIKPDLNLVLDLIPSAIPLALVGLMSVISMGQIIRKSNEEDTVHPNQELIAIGAANIGSGFSSGFGVAASFSRSAINAQSNAQSPVSQLFTSFIIVLTLLFFTPLFYYTPKAILASIILVSVSKMISIKPLLSLWHNNRIESIVLLGTFWSTLTLGIQNGVIIGVLLGLGVHILQSMQPSINSSTVISSKTGHYHLLRLNSNLYFANTSFFIRVINKLLLKTPNVSFVVLDISGCNQIDSTGYKGLQKIQQQCQNLNIEFVLLQPRTHLLQKVNLDKFTIILDLHSLKKKQEKAK